ncbi:MAG: PEP/pyruvate-binding domain-containing protein [Egibacteraceae bacterium]
MTGLAGSEHITWLSECAAAGPSLVGGKALGLGTLCALDLPVPPGFAITTSAYRRHVTDTGLLDRIVGLLAKADTIEARAEVSGQIGTLFDEAGLCEAVSGEVRAAYGGLGEGPVAVRSSADAEDTADASFAGQQESFLWVSGSDDVVRAVARCWASLFTPHAISYRADRDIAPQDVAMGVVVQRMVPATAAGVMMTLDPVTGDRSQIAIEACYGLGIGVVSGEVTPDRFFVDKVTLDIRAREPMTKHGMFTYDPGSRRVRLVDVPSDQRDRPCLTDGEVRHLAGLGKRIERDLGVPQDIEWAFGEGDQDERELSLLQARPETVWSKKRRPAAAAGTTAMDRLLATLRTPMKLKNQ